jgi:transglutaminase-like putative cysteine protease
VKDTRKGLLILFLTRLFLYFAVLSLPLIHPGISVAYDRTGLVLWFGVVPLQGLIAFWPGPFWGMGGQSGGGFIKKRLRVILALAVFALGAVLGPGLSAACLPMVGAGCLSFLLTTLLFRFPRWGKAAVIEQIFFALISFRMLGFSRSSEEVAAESSALTQGILIFTLAAFLLHGMVIYYCLFRREGDAGAAPSRAGVKKRRETAAFAFAASAALILLIAVLPPDFVKNSVISNLLQDKVDPEPVPIDEEGEGMPDGNLRSRRNRGNRQVSPRGQGNGQGGARLEGLPESRWPTQPGDGSSEGEEDGRGEGERQGTGSGKGNSKQYAVMVVAAKTSPVYAAGSYREELHPLRGFLPTKDEILNRLPSMRLLETWFDFSYGYDRGRALEEVFALSTLPEKYLPYKPVAVEPTVLQKGYGPFRYSHKVRSVVSRTRPQDWLNSRELTPGEKEEYAKFLDPALAKNDLAIFEAHLRGALEKAAQEEDAPKGPFARILAILKSFSAFQYNVGYTEDASIPALVDFLTYTKEGDCTEFSNAAAVLGRLAGVPSRVVTGFLAAEDLQTSAHLRGLAVLRNQIKLLQEFPPEELFLVTTAHRHSWTQFWLSGYGWVDFEATSFAIPPIGMGDANNRDVVIPIFEKEPEITPLRNFPWRPVLRALGILICAALVSAYALRYGREFLLLHRARRCDEKGVIAVYKLLLMRLAAEGAPIKLPSQTSREYAGLFPDEPAFTPFAALYTQLRYRDFSDKTELVQVHEALRGEYRKILAGRRRNGPRGALRRIFSLRGLLYL